jgi:hypothetical protein
LRDHVRVWLHEAIGIALIAMIVAHLVVDWAWVKSRIAILTRPSQRRFGALLLTAVVPVLDNSGSDPV